MSGFSPPECRNLVILVFRFRQTHWQPGLANAVDFAGQLLSTHKKASNAMPAAGQAAWGV